MSDKTCAAVAAVLLLASVVPTRARGDVRRETTERRPYIVEIGEPYSISMPAVQREAAKISDLQTYIWAYGYPDYAEVQEIAPQWPWESYEVRLYYLRRNTEVAFGHVFLSPAMPNYGVLKFRGEIPPQKRHEIDVVLEAREAPPPAPATAEAPAPVAAPPAVEEAETPGLSEALVARIEAAAERAALAADRAAEQSEAATRSADRTVELVEMMVETAGPQRRRAR